MALKLTPRGQGAKGFRPDEVVESGWGYETPAGLFSLPYVRSAPLFIHDLFDHNLWEWKEFMALEVDKSSFAKEFDPSRVKNLLESRSTPAVPPTKHMMILLPSQTCIHPDGSRTISAVCFHCLYHFTLRIQANSGHDLCRVRAPTGGTNIADAINGPHQLYLENRNFGPASTESRYNPVILRGLYACTSEQCGLQVVVEVSAPRIDAKWVDLLTNQDRIKKRLEDLKAADPERFDIGPNEWHKAGLRQLVTYLKDLLDAADHGKEPRTLSKRNKRFEAVMGPEFYELFRFLEYKEFSRGEGEDEEHFFLQTLPEPCETTTEPGSRRAFFEDIALESRIHGEREIFRSPLTPLNLDELNRSLAKKDFQAALDCQNYPSQSTNGALTYHFRFLGILPDFHPKLVYNSRAKLSAFLPDFKATFEDSMYSIARDTSGHLGLNAEFLRRAKAVVGEDGDDMFNETWGLAPSNIRRTDDEVITAVRKKLRDSPEAVDIIFEMLPVYARSRGSKRLLRLIDWVSTLLPMPIDLAFDVLGARPDDSAKQLILNAQTRVKVAKAATIANAMRAIARYREDSVLSRQAEITAEGPITNPVGLENIGNTCYLNSIIQYLYTVQPIRGLIDDYAENKLEIDDMEKRRIGGSKVKVQPVDLVIGHYFTGEALQTLFAQMTTVFRGPCAPSQGLANAVLLSSEQLLRLAKSAAEPQAYAGMFPAPSTNVRRTPPPLPARPTPAVPLKQADETANDPDPPLIDLTGPSRSSSPTLMGDAASDRSFDQTKVDAMEISEEAATAVNADADAKIGQAPGVTVFAKAKDDVEMTDGETVASGDDEGSIKSTADTPDSETEGLLNTLKVKHELTMIQQDVDEIMGRVLGLLQASIKPTSIENDIQIETVMQTFFFKVIMRTISYQDGDLRTPHETKSAEFFRNLTAYPAPDGPCTLYQALDNNFDQEEIEGTTTSRYSSIESLPPILHVLVQRTKGDGTKNPNPVVIEEYLQLDRYMDAPPGSDLMYFRETSWTLKKQRAALLERENLLSSMDNIHEPIDPAQATDTPMMGDENDKAALESSDSRYRANAISVLRLSGLTNESSDQRGAELLSFIEPLASSDDDEDGDEVDDANDGDDDIDDVDAERKILPPTNEPSFGGDDVSDVRQIIQQDLNSVQSRLDNLFAGMNNYNYALHAVVCHTGSGRGGHYWVWIRDFEEKTWRKYNDTVVSEERDTRKLLDTLNSSGDPYFLCYVRDVDKEQHVSVPKRQPAGLD